LSVTWPPPSTPDRLKFSAPSAAAVVPSKVLLTAPTSVAFTAAGVIWPAPEAEVGRL
jgi:hypothetical protein